MLYNTLYTSWFYYTVEVATWRWWRKHRNVLLEWKAWGEEVYVLYRYYMYIWMVVMTKYRYRRGWPEGKSVTKDDLLRTVGVGKEGACNIIIINLGDTTETINNLSSRIYILRCRTYTYLFLFLFSTRSRFLQQPDWLTYQFPLIRILGAIEKKKTQNINNKLLYAVRSAATLRRTGRTCH